MNPPNPVVPIRLAIVGCGAVSELFHAPSIAALVRASVIDVVAVCDPDPARRAALLTRFPNAASVPAVNEVWQNQPELVLIASPPRLHPEQAIAGLEAGAAVLCEKPMAPTAAEAEGMAAAATRHGRPLAIGHIRRFFPAARLIQELVASGRLGRFRFGSIQENGGFEWPFRSASAFQPAFTPGGVLLDIGAHVIDLLLWWFGHAQLVSYEDDWMGGQEANVRLALHFPEGAAVSVRISRDWPQPTLYDFTFEHGRVTWAGLDLQNIRVELFHAPAIDARPVSGTPLAQSWHDCFLAQLLNVIDAARTGAPLVMSGQDALGSVRMIEQCYRGRQLLVSPWFSDVELDAARASALESAAC